MSILKISYSFKDSNEIKNIEFKSDKKITNIKELLFEVLSRDHPKLIEKIEDIFKTVEPESVRNSPEKKWEFVEWASGIQYIDFDYKTNPNTLKYHANSLPLKTTPHPSNLVEELKPYRSPPSSQ